MKYYEIENNKLLSISSLASEIEPFFNETYIVDNVLSQTSKLLENTKNINSVNDFIELNRKNYYDKAKETLSIGTNTHAMIEYAIKNNKNALIDIEKIADASLKNTASAWNNFIKCNKLKFIFSELPVFSDLYAGRIDLCVKYQKKYAILDIKTTSFREDNTMFFSRSHLLQLSMYHYCISYLNRKKIYKYSIKDLKYDTVYNVDLSKYKRELNCIASAPCLLILYLDKSNGLFNLLRFGRKETTACRLEVKKYLQYKSFSKKKKDITKRSRYVKVFDVPIKKIDGKNYIARRHIKEYLYKMGYAWNKRNSYNIYIMRFKKDFIKKNGELYLTEKDFFDIINYVINKRQRG